MFFVFQIIKKKSESNMFLCFFFFLFLIFITKQFSKSVNKQALYHYFECDFKKSEILFL